VLFGCRASEIEGSANASTVLSTAMSSTGNMSVPSASQRRAFPADAMRAWVRVATWNMV
jgi:hypothetical protein